ncbi:hypothetical protein C1X64_27870 [Pseudomonas sp. GW456-E7]|nr:hypothetical protein C1X64_27870 [Pseudomonas sp. GW456-E7]
MNLTNVSISVVDSATVTLTRDLPPPSNKTVRIQAIKGGKYILFAGEHGAAPEKIVARRVGKDLHVSLEGEDPDAPRRIIEDFYEFEGQLIGMSQDSTYHPYVVVDAEGGLEAAFLQDGISSPLALDRASLAGFEPRSLSASGGHFSTSVLGIGALGLLGVAAKAGGGGGGGSAQAPVTPTTTGCSAHSGRCEYQRYFR